ncbi:dethiobiotin synthetase BioD [Methanobrevibacter ruminantium M1]|uniref:ATP-dependent dethiobiotin synthetase BioD n=1 Tax=Methanobrevibacter ruminantium (strain ATCC 35063 / DSM 1093 / JCM 13430 / OCM 146 / M1) TaxID=634498 RepID=D3E0W2_METRM|nr:dethiobiotin synthase [Methanobrevibacter ruminantium]ADC47936.1 dethiobiotin synthetase BioD [Methanobrevibacter ruminantium M1]
MSKGLFVLGTGTDVGKTYVTGLLLKYIRDNGYNASYFKAALSGAIRDNEGKLIPGDAVEVINMAGLEEDTDFLVPYIYETAVSPHLASQIEGNPVELDKVKHAYEEVSKKYDYIVMEGSGGIVCPIRYDGQGCKSNILLEDIIKCLDLNVLLVADAGLGTINSVITTVDYLKNRDIQVCGILLNNFKDMPMENDNLKMIEELGGVDVIAKIYKNDKNLSLDVQLDVLMNYFK